jgi:hypothetical protein
MDLASQLVELERRFWTGGAEFYRENLTESALMAFPEPLGLMGRESAIEAVAQAPRWEKVELEEARVLRFAPDVAALAYKALAWREGKEGPYSAVVSSTYVRGGGAWRLGFHQQTPAPGA